MLTDLAPVIITTGEPAGIGPDISLMLLAQLKPLGLLSQVVLAGDRDLLTQRAQMLNIEPTLLSDVSIAHIPVIAPVVPGVLNTDNAPYVLHLLDHAIEGCLQGRYRAMVTAPLQKSVIADTGLAFSGHTEYLAEKTGTPHVVMMLANSHMRVALATTHLPLSAVPAAITAQSLTQTLTILIHDLKHHFGIEQPRVLVTGLNPHAGESGHLGREEIDVIEPVIKLMSDAGAQVFGPYPADTLFQAKYLNTADAVLAMYHDQGLPVLKYAGFGDSVNITLGLPFLRTSVDHGTALDLAGTGKAHAGSLAAAVHMALQTQPRQQASRSL